MKDRNEKNKIPKAIVIIIILLIVFLAGFGLAKVYFDKNDDEKVQNSQYDSSYDNKDNEVAENKANKNNKPLDQKDGMYLGDNAIDNYEVSQEQITNLIDKLELSYDEAINTGEVELTYPYLTETGNLRKNYDKYLLEWHEEGLRTYIKDADYGQLEHEENGEYRISRVSVNKVVKNNKSHYEKEYIEFILVENDDSELLIDRCENYSMLDSDFDYSE